MSDHMLLFPSRSSSACEPEEVSDPSQHFSPAPASPSRYRGLTLVKGRNVAPKAPLLTGEARLWRTREIIAQVEQEIAARAARQHNERFGQVHAIPSREASASGRLRRDTPWSVAGRVLRSLLRR